MPRPTRQLRLDDLAFDLLASSPYVCNSCRHLALRQRIGNQPPLRHASSKNIPFTEKLRRKIWGTDNPPGLADPYGGPSFLERYRQERDTKKKSQQQETVEEEVRAREPPETTLGPGWGNAVKEAEDEQFPEPKYVAAESWEGLEHYGHTGDWRDIEPTPADKFTPFLGELGQKATKPADFLSALHQSIVEVFTLQFARKNVDILKSTRLWYGDILQMIANTKICLPTNGACEVTLRYPTESTRGVLLGWFAVAERNGLAANLEVAKQKESLMQTDIPDGGIMWNFEKQAYEPAEEKVDSETETFERQMLEHERAMGRDGEADEDPLYTQNFYKTTDQSFLDMKLDFRSKTTFAVLSRFTQLTGHRIPDPVLGKAKTLRSIFLAQVDVIKPKPKNIAEVLLQKKELAALPNVKIMSRRETPVDKEKEIGRWKVIEAELKSRGLPVLGRPQV